MKRVNSPKIIRPQINPLSSPQLTQTLQIANQEEQNQHFMRPVQQKQQEAPVDQPSVTIEKTGQTSRQQINQHGQQVGQFQRIVDPSHCQVSPQKMLSMQYQGRPIGTDQVTDSDKQEVVALNDGKVISIEEYKDMLLKQQQQRMNLMPEVSVKKRSPNPNTIKPRAKTPNTITNRSRSKIANKGQELCSMEGIEPSRFTPQQAPVQRYMDNSKIQQPRRLPLSTPPTQMQNRAPQVQLQPNQSNQKMTEKPTSTQSGVPSQHQHHHQPTRQNNHNYLIQPPKQNINKPVMQCPLPKCVPSNQIKKIIENTPVSEEYSDSIRMLVMLANGEQRLITFTLPNQACTIQEILEQVGVPLQPDTLIDVSEANSNGINYMVTVGFMQNTSQAEECSDSMPADNNYQTTPVADPQLQVTLPAPSPPLMNEPSPEPVEEPSPVREVEVPKYIEGKMAVCGYCGILSDDFNKCMRCKTKLPENVKAIAAVGSMKKGDNKVQKKDSVNIANTNGTKDSNVKKKQTTKGRHTENDTVILTLSSDEEEESVDAGSAPINENILQKLGSAITLSPIKKEPSVSDIQKTTTNIDNEKTKLNLENLKSIFLQCRTVRIGSYRTIPKENVIIDYSSVTLKVSNTANTKDLITIRIDRNDIVKVLISFQKQLPVLFYYLRPSMGNLIREMLGMKENDINYYDPLSDNESHRRITLLPENISEEAKSMLLQIYRSSATCNILDELTVKEANDILIKTCPKELTLANLQTSASNFEVKPLFTYPPEGRGRISINTEDYMCLGSDQFLNDVIIDFYLKFLVHNLSQEEQERIHVFSTFFYKRLTTKPVKASRKNQPAELDPTLTPAEKRHARVKTWTKNIDLFKKDYVIVPINENCHWFLAIICFPGLDGCQTMDGHPIKIDIAPKKKKNLSSKTTIGNVTITAVKKEDIPCEDLESDKDEAEGDESELESDDSEETQTITSHSSRPPIKQPCILIFDSLAGTGRSRVVATLRDYLTCEYKTKYSTGKVFNKDVIKGACPKVPQQTNFTDCGLYLLQYVEHFFMEPIKDYYIPINSLKNWFDEITVTRKREDISILIKTLMMDYKKDVGLLPEIMFPTKNGVIVDQFADDDDMDEEMSENEEFGSPPIGSETEIDSSMSIQEEESMKFENSPIKPSCESVSDRNEITEQTVSSIELLKPDISELSMPKIQSNKDALSYLKAKRIIRHKNLDNPSKKLKNSE
ncbi:hypothetical protein HHI36_004689 [Cryptolaemus montrouzieri]|uniref:Ubiquitin-like protease family profile domain-containing protein n=1 Tax=Cryptolaemus montrouzieri TaxID=559131 RepID=A0ABD2NTH4_9CUCU